MEANNRSELQEVFRAVFGTSEGQQALKWLMKKYHAVEFEFVNDGLLNAYKEGQRSVVLSIIKLIEKDADAIINTIRKAHHER